MQVCANLPPVGRDFRLDLFRGLANWAIFLDHIPHEVLNWITIKNYGFSDAADLFVFISGYTAAFVFGRVMIERAILPPHRDWSSALCSSMPRTSLWSWSISPLSPPLHKGRTTPTI